MTIKLFEVGGAVRDSLMGRQSSDIDFAVEAESFESMQAEIEALGFKTIMAKPEFFTIKSHAPPNSEIRKRTKTVDFVFCRIDGPSLDGRRPAWVKPGTIIDDLARRDFTMNAIAKDAKGELIDPWDGARDIAERRIRFVGDPEERIAEDGLRILRAIRFSATLGFGLSGTTFDAIHWAEPSLMDAVSSERILDELKKMFSADCVDALKALSMCPMLLPLLAERGIWFKPTLEVRNVRRG